MTRQRQFASIAEAVAFYHYLGYQSVDFTALSRIMRRGRDEVIINKEGFLNVVAEECFPAC